MTKSLIIGLVGTIAAAAAISACTPATTTEKCPTFSVTSEVGKPAAGSATFTLKPTRDGLTYNWSTSAGTITSGQGTASAVVEAPASDVTATAEVGGLDASCPAGSNTASATATIP